MLNGRFVPVHQISCCPLHVLASVASAIKFQSAVVFHAATKLTAIDMLVSALHDLLSLSCMAVVRSTCQALLRDDHVQGLVCLECPVQCVQNSF